MKLKIKPNSINLVFMGTSNFAKKILASLLEREYNITAVYTQIDKPVGRKQEVIPTPVKHLAQKNKIKVFQPKKFDKQEIEKLKEMSPDLIIVADYGKILPPEVLEIPTFNCLNVHASLLPKLRGPSPIQNALWKGKRKTGVTIIIMNENIDTGDIVSQKEQNISKYDTFLTLEQKLAELGGDLLVQTIPLWINQKIEPRQQDESKATLCQLIERNDGRIFFEKTAKEIYNQYRALYPWPGIFAFWNDRETLKRIKFIKISYNKNNPSEKFPLGKVFKEENTQKIAVQTGQGIIYLEKVQLEGKFAFMIEEFINGYPHFIGSILK